jgi:hypothetical protein
MTPIDFEEMSIPNSEMTLAPLYDESCARLRQCDKTIIYASVVRGKLVTCYR